MNYKLFVFAPNDENVITKIIEAASKAGAGVVGKYTQCAFITKGHGNWKSEKGSHPTIGKVGQVSREPEVKIEMTCPAEKAVEIKKAIYEAHPYEALEVNFVELKEI